MDEIDYIARSSFFANQSGNPASLDSALNRVHSLIVDYDYRKESPEVVYYLDRIAEDMILSEADSVGPNPMSLLPYHLEYSITANRDVPDDIYLFYMFYVLCKLHYNLGDRKGMRKLIKRYSSRFQDQAYYGKLDSLSFIGTYNEKEASVAIDKSLEYSEKYPQYPELHKVFAEAVAELAEKDIQYTGSKFDLAGNHQTLLERAKLEISRALEWDSVPAEYLAVKARIESLDGEYDAAIDSINQAIGELSRSRTRYSNLRGEFARTKNRIETQRQQSELIHRTDRISKSVENIKDGISSSEKNIENLKSEISEIRQDFQRTILEFLGFFSAIIAAIVITGQIALEVNDPQVAGQLMVISYGGLLFAFGGFAAMLSSNLRDGFLRFLFAVGGLSVALIILYWG